MSIVSEKNIDKVSFLYAIIVVGVMTFSTGTLFILKKIDTMKKDLVKVEQEFITQQKQQLKKDVESIIKRIDVRRVSTEKILTESLKNRVFEVQNMAAGIYQKMHESFPVKEIEDVIREAVRPIRFNEKQGYFFILTLNGDSILSPIVPEIEGSSYITDRGGDDAKTAQDMIRIAQEDGNGFYGYSWTKPGDDSGKIFEKISYISLFEPLGWVIGTGEYLDNLTGFAKTSIGRDLSDSLAAIKTDYYFVYDLHSIVGGKDFATMLINNNRPDLVGKKLSDDYVDAKGKEFRKEFLEGIRKNGEAYVVYWYKKPDGSGIGRKLSYFKLYSDWNWVFARGIYFDSLDEVITERKDELSGKVRDDIGMLCVIFLVAVLIALFVAYRFSKELQEIFDSYRETQDEHLKKLEILNQTLEKQSHTDALTQVFNRGFFNIQLTRETSRAARYKTPLSVIMMDIDFFKKVNDTYGHLTGDAVLQEMAILVGDNIRQSDFLARWGGEEFSILVPGVRLDQALVMAEKLRLLVEENRFSIEQQVTCSFGISCYQPPENGNSLLERADVALYKAKEDGRNRCAGN